MNAAINSTKPTVTVFFDSTFKSKNTGKIFYDYDTTTMPEAHDNELVWVHIHYGRMRLYKLLQVDDSNYIAQDMHKFLWPGDENYEHRLAHPELEII